MPPNLHPRSSHTTTLFTTTLAISFLVVGLPHLFPCPVPSRQHLDATTIQEVADEDGRRVYRRVYKKPPLVDQQISEHGGGHAGLEGGSRSETGSRDVGFGVADTKERQCPVPKPKGFIGRWMGFDGDRTEKRREDVVIARGKGDGHDP